MKKKHAIEGRLCSIQEAVIFVCWIHLEFDSLRVIERAHKSSEDPFHSGYFIGPPAPLLYLFSPLPLRDIASRFG